MNNFPLVSVIIPVYGVEKYIEQCCESLFSQSYPNIEFIFVNDCTKDRSIELIKECIQRYPKRKDSVLIIDHETNKGLPQARATGVRYAHGDFIAHCDSDDYVDTCIYESLVNEALSSKADIVICDYYLKTETSLDVCKCNETIDLNTVINLLLQRKEPGSLCNKLYKRSLYNNSLVTPISFMSEDMTLNVQLFRYCSKIARVSEPLYYYRVFKNKVITKDKAIQIFNQQKTNVDLVLNVYNNDLQYNNSLDILKYNCKCVLRPYITENSVYNLWKDSYKEINVRILFNQSLPLYHKIIHLLCLFKLSRMVKYILKNR